MADFKGSAQIAIRRLKWEFSFRRTVILTASVRYPEGKVPGSPRAERSINSRIKAQTAAFHRYVSGPLYRSAAADFRYAKANHSPFHPYQALLDYEVSLNCGGYLSIFRDRYEYTGGAHGSTVRLADTWDLKNGRRVFLRAFFCRGKDWQKRVLGQILQQADKEMRENPGIFFDDYRDRIPTYWNPEHFYLTPAGIAVYYQQYEIAPYSSGIVLFPIQGDRGPACKRR